MPGPVRRGIPTHQGRPPPVGRPCRLDKYCPFMPATLADTPLPALIDGRQPRRAQPRRAALDKALN